MPVEPVKTGELPDLSRLRGDSRAIFDAGVAAVDPMVAVQRAVVRRGDTLEAGGVAYDLRAISRVYVVGAGKGSAVMAQGLESVLADRLSDGAVTVKYGHGAPVKRVTLHEAAHPIRTTPG